MNEENKENIENTEKIETIGTSKNADNKKKKSVNWAAITWIVLLAASIVFFFIATGFIIFPSKYKLPLGAILFVLAALMGFFSLRKRKVQKGKLPHKRIAVIIINCVLSVLMIGGSVYLPILQAKMKGLFVEPTSTETIRINAYVMTSDYKNAHSDVFTNTSTSTDLSDYKDAKFITQSQVDQDNQSYAVKTIQKKMNVDTLNTVAADDVVTSLNDLYNGTGDVMILNEALASTVTEISGYENFNTDTQILYTVEKEVQVSTATPDSTASASNYTNSSFMMFIAGSDSRSAELTQYTRTDVDILLTVDPVNKQILVISMPRDWYVKNPALSNGYDKLTHLGNNGMQNTMDGLNQEYGFDYIKNYLEVNFVTFSNIIDTVGGIDINNPYEFTDESGDTFTAGTVHLDGPTALNYVRDRHTLSNGDYGRNEHQAIVLQAIIQKLTSKEILSDASSLLNKLQGNFLSSMSSDDFYSLAAMQLNDGGSWKFISYHLGGVGAYNTTASMGSMQLYVSYPIQSQVEFAVDQMTKVMNGENIKQETLPEEDQTVYLPN